MILVTGGTGLVGSHILYNLCSSGLSVKALKRATSNIELVKSIFRHYDKENAESLFSKIDWADGDLLAIDQLDDVMYGVDTVYHAAGMVSFDKKDREKLIKVNIEGTANLVNLCITNKVKKIGYVSSVSVLGKSKLKLPLDESCHWELSKENSDYAISKFGAEREVWRASEEGVEVVMVNPSIILGPGDWNKSSARLFKNCYKGISHYPSGGNGFVDVRDVATSLIALVNSDIKSERYILSGSNLTFKNLFTLISNGFGKTPPKKQASKFAMELAWRALKVKSWFTGKSPKLTKASAKSSQRTVEYNATKIVDAIDFNYTSIENSVENGCEYYTKNRLS